MSRKPDKNSSEYKKMNEYMHSLIKSLQIDVQNKFLSNPKLYIYYKYNSDILTLYIFVKVTKRNPCYKDGQINYLIILGQEYPERPPYVCCLTDFHEKINIFDMRNIQKNLIGEWSQKCSISDIIYEMLTFSDTLAFQSDFKLLPLVGEYLYGSYIYDLNDFLLNSENLLFRTFYFSDVTGKKEDEDFSKNEAFMVITNTTILFFKSKNNKNKKFCRLEYKFELIWIDSMRRYTLNKYPDFYFFEFLWNNHSNYTSKFVFGTKSERTINDKIYDTIIDRKRYLLNNFKFFEKYNDNNIQIMEQIIEIKENYFKQVRFSKFLYDQICELYKKIINKYNSMNINDNGYKMYIQNKLQNFIAKYDKYKYMKY